MNHYPLWKYLFILFVIAGLGLYALPNLYPNVPAVQISHESGELSNETLATVEQALNEKNIEIKGKEQSNNKILLRFENTEKQLQASEISKQALDGRHVVALNLAPATPGWLRGLGATPMNLGLDLRGGVHFLLQVDMVAAIDKAINSYVSSFRVSSSLHPSSFALMFLFFFSVPFVFTFSCAWSVSWCNCTHVHV